VEHLGRATAESVDALLVVVEPTARSLATAGQIKSLACDIRLKNVLLVGSKVRDEADHLPEDPRVIEADRQGLAIYDLSPELAQVGRQIAQQLGEMPQIKGET